jgi:hypothetical protein
MTVFISQAIQAQPFIYQIDSTAFSALMLEGGMMQIKYADVNHDGHVDLINIGDHGSPFINTNQHGICVFFGNGTGTGWVLHQNGNFGYGGIAAGDINNDGLMDVAYSMHHDYSTNDFGNQLIEAALGDGTGMNWTPWDDSLATAGETYGMFGTDLGDANNDGWLDILSGSFGCCAGTHVYLNNGTGVWSHSFGFLGGNTMHYCHFGEFNHDGNLDFIHCHQNAGVYFGNGLGNFTAAHLNLPPTGTLGFDDVAAADVDNDGDDEIAFISQNTPYVYRWNNITQQWNSISSGIAVSGTAWVVELGDLDADGWADLVVGSGNSIYIFKNNNGTSWTNVYQQAFPNLTRFEDIAIADVDHNGYGDITFVARFQISLFTYRNKMWLLRNLMPATQLSIQMIYPAGFECVPNNAVRFIRWQSQVPAGHPSSVSIEFSYTGPAGPWIPVAGGVPNNGVYQVQAPSSLVSNDCYLRLIVTDSITWQTDTAMNANPFQIGTCNPALLLADSGQPLAAYVTPNPFHSFFTLVRPQATANAIISIYDATGRLMLEQTATGKHHHILRGNIAPGIYFLHLREGHQTSIFKLLCSH